MLRLLRLRVSSPVPFDPAATAIDLDAEGLAVGVGGGRVLAYY
jgi:hypothetical protein